MFADLAAAFVPSFCDGLQFDLTADGSSGLRVSFPPAPDGAATAVTLDGHRAEAGSHAEQLSSPGRIVIALHAELTGTEPPVLGTITCT